MQIQFSEKIYFRVKKKGSMTIFASLILVLITSLLLTFLESARVYGLKSYANMTSLLTSESAFAEYSKELFENYDLLFLDAAYGGEEFDLSKLQGTILQLNKDNLYEKKDFAFQKKTNLFHLEVKDITVSEYELATDYEGMIFYQQVVSAMKGKAPYMAIETLKNEIEKTNDSSMNKKNPEEEMENAKNNISSAREARQKKAEQEQKPVVISQEEKNAENPLDFVMKLKTEGILSLVVDRSAELSNQELNAVEDIQNRTYTKGNMTNVFSPDLADKLWYQLYLNQYFGSYTIQKDNTALMYEREYIVCGKDSDKKNLEAVVNRLLMVREAANYAYLLTDSVKTQEALGLATALVGFTANPLIIGAVQYGILGAWAFVESVLDVRMLLSGNKVMPIKTAATWITDILHISQSFESAKNTKSDTGLSYNQYLQGMLSITKESVLSIRTMNLMEKNIWKISGDHTLQMNHLIQSIDVSYTYQASPLFSNILSITKGKLDPYQFSIQKQYSYIKN